MCPRRCSSACSRTTASCPRQFFRCLGSTRLLSRRQPSRGRSPIVSHQTFPLPDRSRPSAASKAFVCLHSCFFGRVVVRLQLFVVFLLFRCAAGTGVSAQQSVDLASVSGRVTDQTGAALADAEVAARHVSTNIAVRSISDKEGRFRFPYLRVGPYEITIRKPGFELATRRLTLTVGSAFELPVTLAVGALDASVTVTA